MSDKLLAEWFWTDRWMGSSAFLLPIEPRGLYREMLTQAWRRGASLPSDHEAVRRAVGCTLAEWKRSWPAIAKYWRVDGDVMVNDTQVQVFSEAHAVRMRASERGRKGAQARAQALTQAPPQAPPQAQREIVLKTKPPSPSLSPYQTKRSSWVHESPEIKALAYELREVYPEVFASCRSGAVYSTTRATEDRDDPKYYGLAETYPDIRRLRAMLEIFLKRDMGDKNSPGTPGQFLNMAPVCDEILRRSGWK